MNRTTSDRLVASHNLATVLRTRGWKIFGHEPTYSPNAWNVWRGCATFEARYPGVVLVVNSQSDIQVPLDGCPAYQANPKGKMWHIEVLYMILEAGVGFTQCNEREPDLSATNAIADIIENRAAACALVPEHRRAMQKTTSPGGITLEQEHRWLWLTFPNQPPRELRRQLGQIGGTFSSARRAWYFKCVDVRPEIERLVGL